MSGCRLAARFLTLPMNFRHFLPVFAALLALVSTASAADAISPQAAAERVKSGEALLIDVREPAEWKDGVAAPALLLPLSDLRGDRTKWKAVLEANADKELVLYCRSGNRSGIAAELLEKEGFRVSNAGGFAAWQEAKLPTRKPE